MLLVEEVEKFKNIIECKTSDKVSNSNKIEAWNKVTFQLNAKGPIQQARSMEQLKAKYENLKPRQGNVQLKIEAIIEEQEVDQQMSLIGILWLKQF
ncbi:hypothetical protein JTB14_009584 [Gonioctena quinquepunctata]|nr:hypothetical protein JTB14_035712 [Gonioctena quinquepunctata]KAG5874144.1 hypothetical protein JTB14_007761 [Gonioctena quinquepunctata]KAG5884580.1 hypothetical protein JTB14_032674 [Gonioctena quinquepunctata]KAG5893580.1 hypothetical protein JTB14_028347 [Gonioctena quinquepunctata]KAG5896377.1 hypothetical protein JTB14_009584 [Gonioctena quinquepunctata]